MRLRKQSAGPTGEVQEPSASQAEPKRGIRGKFASAIQYLKLVEPTGGYNNLDSNSAGSPMPDTKTAVFPSKEDRRRAVEAWKEQIGNKLLAPTVEALKNAPTSKGGRIPRLRNVFVKVGRVDPFSVAKALGVEVVTGQQDDK